MKVFYTVICDNSVTESCIFLHLYTNVSLSSLTNNMFSINEGLKSTHGRTGIQRKYVLGFYCRVVLVLVCLQNNNLQHQMLNSHSCTIRFTYTHTHVMVFLHDYALQYHKNTIERRCNTIVLHTLCNISTK